MLEDPVCVEIVLQHEHHFLKSRNLGIFVVRLWLAVEVDGLVDEEGIYLDPDLLAIVNLVIFEAIIGVGSFEDEDRSGCGMNILDGGDIVGLFGGGCFFEDVDN